MLVVCSEITRKLFRGPTDTHLDSLIVVLWFGDNVATVIGSDPKPRVEKPAQGTIKGSDAALAGQLREVGLRFHLLKDVSAFI
ncbi:hypothetical protein RJ639_019465 [Escallonia herrerae]|uniref:chalcone synthase n=1 Tax=Escallonia herrerae TaxID=1293975 RepID=A0AA89AIC3_9ASTE|nr:hypothetical protein RJ639_019465 [Escallonia herrerae]